MFGANTREDYVVLNYLHSQLMLGTDGPWGQRDPSLTRSALLRPFRSAFGEEIYADPFEKAAALLDAIVNNIVFKDGNKRTALAAATLYLGIKKLPIKFGQNEAEMFMYQVVVARPAIADIASWLRQHHSSHQIVA